MSAAVVVVVVLDVEDDEDGVGGRVVPEETIVPAGAVPVPDAAVPPEAVDAVVVEPPASVGAVVEPASDAEGDAAGTEVG